MPKEIFKDLWQTLKEKKIWKGEIKNRAKDDSVYYVATTIVPILDIRIKFNTGPGTYDQNTSVIAVITEDKRMIGIIVDLVDDVQKLDTSMLAPVSEMGSAIPSKYLKGYVRLDNNQMLVVMDIEKVVAKEELRD